MSIPSLRPSVLAFGWCLAVAGAAPPAHAQELDPQTRSAARELATEGSALYQQGDFEGAYDRFNRADLLVQKPNVGIWAARSLLRAGHLVEASERYRELERTALPDAAPPDQLQAVQDAARERREVLARLPSIKIVVQGADPSSVFVSLDGKLVKPALIGAKQPVNPGKLLVKGVRGEQVVQASIDLLEGQFREVRLVFTGGAPRAAAPASPAAAPKSGAALSAPPRADRGANLRLVGFIGLGVGGAALATGALFSGLAASDESDLDRGCPSRRCAPEFHDLNGSYGTKKTIASVGLIGGAVLAGAGAVLVLTAPARGAAASAGLQLRGYMSASGGGVLGAF